MIILCPAKTAIKLLVYLYLIDDDALCTFLRNNQIPQFFNVIILFSTRGTHLTLSIHFLYRIHLPTPSFDSVIPSTQLAPCLPNPLPFVVHRSKLIFKQTIKDRTKCWLGLSVGQSNANLALIADELSTFTMDRISLVHFTMERMICLMIQKYTKTLSNNTDHDPNQLIWPL